MPGLGLYDEIGGTKKKATEFQKTFSTLSYISVGTAYGQ